MNEPLDPLEAELAALQPRGASPQLRQRIAGELAGSKADPSPGMWLRRRTVRRRIGLFTVAAAIAASAIAAYLLRPTARPTIAEPPARVQEAELTAAFDEALPTVWAYQRALRRSASDVDSLLDKHAAAVPANYRPFPTPVFIRSDKNLLSQGEL